MSTPFKCPRVVRAQVPGPRARVVIAMSQTLRGRRPCSVNAAAEAQVTVNALQSQLEGIGRIAGAGLHDLQTLNAQIPGKLTVYDNAGLSLKKSQASTRRSWVLSAAKGEQTRIDDSLNDVHAG